MISQYETAGWLYNPTNSTSRQQPRAMQANHRIVSALAREEIPGANAVWWSCWVASGTVPSGTLWLSSANKASNGSLHATLLATVLPFRRCCRNVIYRSEALRGDES